MSDSLSSEQAVIKEFALKEADRRWDEASSRLKYSTEYAQTGLKGLFVANGASIVGLLTFVGNSKAVVEPTALWWAFVWFALGLAFVLGAYVAAYLSQAILMNAAFGQSREADSAAYDTGREYSYGQYEENGERAAKAGLASAVLALAFFVIGAFVALDAIT